VAARVLRGLVVPSLIVRADDGDITITNFETGKLADAVREAAGGTDYNEITRIAVLDGTLSADDYAALMSLPNITYLELAGAQTENGAIPAGALQGRNRLAYLSLPKNTTVIGDRAFSNNKQLEKVSMPYSVTRLGNYAFDGCVKLSDIPVSENVVYIGEGAFRDCESVVDFVLPSKITVINDNTFAKCGFDKFYIGPDVVSIGSGAFADCNNLRDVYVYGRTAPTLGEDAFRNVSATVHISVDATGGFGTWARGNIRLSDDLRGEYTLTAAVSAPEDYADNAGSDDGALSIDEETPATDAQGTRANPRPAASTAADAPKSGASAKTVFIVALVFYILGAVSAWLFFVKKKLLKHPLLRGGKQ
jgi:hypothetical protein